MDHDRRCPAAKDDTRACECYEIERELCAEWLDDGAPDDWPGDR